SSPAEPARSVSKVTVWVSSSRFVHRTVVPTGTVRVDGRYFDSLMSTRAGDTARASAPRATTAATTTTTATSTLQGFRRCPTTSTSHRPRFLTPHAPANARRPERFHEGCASLTAFRYTGWHRLEIAALPSLELRRIGAMTSRTLHAET